MKLWIPPPKKKINLLLTGLILTADAAVLEDASEDVSVLRVLVPANTIAIIHININMVIAT